MPKINIFIKLIASVFLVIFAAGFIVFALKNKIEISAKKIYEKQNMLMALQRRESNVAQLRADYKIVEKNLPVVKTILPEEKNIGKIVDALESLAARTNNTQDLNFASASQSENMEAAKSISFTAVLTGSNASFVSYFRELKNLPYLIEVDSIAISNSSGISNNNTQLSFTAKAFIKK